MLQNQVKANIKVLLSCLPILIICAIIQYASFPKSMQWEYRFATSEKSVETREEAEQIAADIEKNYGNALVYVNIKYDDYESKWLIEYETISKEMPILNDLLSRTIHAPLIISTIILLTIIIILLIEQDYRPDRSVLTLLRLPRPRSRYILEKLISPITLMFLFWIIQYLVAMQQTANYFNAVSEAVRPSNQSPWTFDYYRILYPVIEPIWFPATVCGLCMIPLIIETIVFIAKGGMKSWFYGILPIVGATAVVLTVNRVTNMWWIMPAMLIAVYLNCRILVNKGQIVQ